MLSAPNAGASTQVGSARIVHPSDAKIGADLPVDNGGSETPFSLSLPSGAACKGDSANDGYRVQSYMVPSGTDLASLNFGSVGPQPVGTGAAFRQPLYAITTEPYVNEQTANADHPGDPGYIINIAAFNLSVFKPGDVPPGVYNVGIACTRGPASPTQLQSLWNTQVRVTADRTDKPAGVTWQVAGSSAQASAGTPPPSVVVSPPAKSETGVSKGTGSIARSSSDPAPSSSTLGTVPSRKNSGASTLASAGSPDPSQASSPAAAATGPAAGGEPPGGPPTATPAVLEIARFASPRRGSVALLLAWGSLLVIFARMGLLFARPVQVRAAAAG